MQKSTRTPTLPIRPSSGHLEPRYVKATVLGAKQVRPFKVRLQHLGPHLKAALAGFGLAHLTEQQVRRQLNNGELVRVLANWCPPYSGYHLYYPSRRQHSAAFALVVDALRYPAGRIAGRPMGKNSPSS